MAIQTYGGAKLLLFSDICKRKVKKSKKKCIFATNRDSFRDGLATVLHRACIPLWTGALLISNLSAAYQHPIRSLSALLARDVQV